MLLGHSFLPVPFISQTYQLLLLPTAEPGAGNKYVLR
jgi:hypothetical protein